MMDFFCSGIISSACHIYLLSLTCCCMASIPVDQENLSGASSFDSTTAESLGPSLPKLAFQPYVQHRIYGIWVGNVTDKGMRLLYSAVNWMISTLQQNEFPKDLISESDLRYPENLVKSFKKNYVQWLRYDQGFIVTGFVCLALAVLFTLFYLVYFVCCVCCCVRKSKRKPRFDQKCDGCKRCGFNGILAVFIVAMIFAVVCAFISNQHVHASANSLPKKIRYGLEDVETYRDETIKRLNKLFIDDYRNFNSTILFAVKKTSTVVVSRLKQVSGVVALDLLSAVSERASELERNLSTLVQTIGLIEETAVALKNNLSQLHQSKEFQEGLQNCLRGSGAQKETCENVEKLLEEYQGLPEHLLNLGRLVPLRQEIQAVSVYNISSILSEARREFTELEKKFEVEVSSREIELKYHLEKYGENFTHYVQKITRRLEKVDLSSAYSVVDNYQELFVRYEYYRWMGGLVVASALALMVLCFGFGLFYGVFGKPPSYYEDDCCVRSTGSKLYCFGIMIGTLVLVVFMLMTVGFFLIGANSQNLVCDPLYRPRHRSDVYDFIQKFIDWQEDDIPSELRNILYRTNISDILEGCERNETLYEIFHVEKHLGIREILTGEAPVYTQLATALESIKENFRVKDNLKQPFLSAEVQVKLEKLKELDVKAVPQNLTVDLENKIDSFDIWSELPKVEQEVDKLYGREMNFLKEFVRELRKLEVNGLTPLKSQLMSVTEDLKSLNRQIPKLMEEVPHWISLLKNAQGLLASNVSIYIDSIAARVVRQLSNYISDYRLHVKEQLSTEVSSCGPLKSLGNASAISLCEMLLYPFNSFWASVAICLLLAIPTMVIATSLRDLYRHMEDQSGSSDCYCQPAEIPLNGLSNRSRRCHRRRVNAYSADDSDYYSCGRRCSPSGYTSWRAPSSSSYFDDIGGPPPPYFSPKRRKRR